MVNDNLYQRWMGLEYKFYLFEYYRYQGWMARFSQELFLFFILYIKNLIFKVILEKIVIMLPRKNKL